MSLRIELLDDERADAAEASSTLAKIVYGPVHRRRPDAPRELQVGLPPLNPAPFHELWRVSGRVTCGWEDGMGWSMGQRWFFAHLLAISTPAEPLADSTRRTYTRLLNLARSRGFAHPVRIWNVVSRIHEDADGMDRYQAFSVGRACAFDDLGFPTTRYPAATAVGAESDGLLVYLLAGCTPGTPVENPRQMHPYHYPERYGPRSPSFARAMHCGEGAERQFLISGTASVVGHQSLHPGKLVAQLDETLRNLDTLTNELGQPRPKVIKVFLRDPRDCYTVDEVLRQWAPSSASILYLRAEICRRELEIEIEGV